MQGAWKAVLRMPTVNGGEQGGGLRGGGEVRCTAPFCPGGGDRWWWWYAPHRTAACAGTQRFSASRPAPLGMPQRRGSRPPSSPTPTRSAQAWRGHGTAVRGMAAHLLPHGGHVPLLPQHGVQQRHDVAVAHGQRQLSLRGRGQGRGGRRGGAGQGAGRRARQGDGNVLRWGQGVATGTAERQGQPPGAARRVAAQRRQQWVVWGGGAGREGRGGGQAWEVAGHACTAAASKAARMSREQLCGRPPGLQLGQAAGQTARGGVGWGARGICVDTGRGPRRPRG